MDLKGFQAHCSMLDERLENNIVNDGDVDTFSDIVSNVLGRDDFRATGTAYDKLDRHVSDIYENALIQPMPPLIARLYQICRMFDMYRPRPMTELEIEERRSESNAKPQKKYALLLDVKDGIKTIANCWWENLGGTDDAADVVAKFAEALGDKRDLDSIVNAFAAVGSGFEMLDEQSQELYPNVPIVSDRSSGVIGVGKDGVARNKKRHGHQVKIEIDNDMVYSDNYMVWGLDFYKEDCDDQDIDVSKLPIWTGDLIYYKISDASAIADKIKAMPVVFGCPGAPKHVGTKFVPTETPA